MTGPDPTTANTDLPRIAIVTGADSGITVNAMPHGASRHR